MKVLLIKRGAIGDLLMATPFIRQLKQSINCSIDVLVGKDSSIVLTGNSYINNKFIIDDSWFTIRKIHKFVMYLYKFRKNNYDYVFVLDKHWYFNLCVNILGCLTVGFKRDFISRYLLDYSVVYNDINKYQGVYYLELLHKIKPNVVNFNDLKLDINISSLSKSKVDDWIIQQNIHKFAIVVNSGGNNAFESNGVRMMPFDKTTSLLQELSKKYEKILLVGGSVDVDSYNRYVYKLENIDNVLNVAGYFTLSESAYLISLSEMAYITDCGALHLAIASGCNKNMIAIFSATNPNHFMPKELLQRAYWQDEDVYTDRYSLYGNKKIKHHKYFTKLKIRDLIDFDCVK